MSGAGISLRDEMALVWYFKNGERRFRRSTHGAIVDKLERDSAGCSCCRICEGAGILEDAQAVDRHKKRKKTTERRRTWVVREEHKKVDGRDAGTVLVEEEAEIWAPIGIGSYCQFCQGTGVRPKVRRNARKCPDCEGLMKAERQRCRTCFGKGTVSLDARVKSCREESRGIEVDGDTLRRFAVVSRRLATMPRSHQKTLENYFGPLGEYWGGHSVQAGRFVALQADTRSGRRLLAKTKQKGDEATRATPEQRIDTQWALQARDPKTWRYELLDASLREAKHRLSLAERSWTGVESTPGWRDVLEWLKRHIDDTADRVEAWNDEFRSEVDWAIKESDGVWR